MKINTIKLIFLGNGSMKGWCKVFISKDKIKVGMKGFVPNKEAKELIANSKALYITSTVV